MASDLSPLSFRRGWLDEPTLPPLLSLWEDHPEYGLVHPSGCGVCRPYTDHVADASCSTTQPSFQIALKARESRRVESYYDGITEGRRRQKVDDRQRWEDLERYHRERDTFKEELDAIKAELEIARGAVTKRKEECQRFLGGPAEGMLSEQHDADNKREMTFKNNTTWPPRLLKSSAGFSPPLTLPKPVASYASVASSQLPSPPSTAHLSHQTPSSPTSSLPPTSSSPPDSYFPSSTTTQPNISSIRALQSLCTAAHQPGNHVALARVKALCTEAHATPKECKTDVQRWLLSNWRSPAWEKVTGPNGAANTVNCSSFPVPTTPGPGMHPPRLDSPIEAWVAYLSVHPTSWPRGVRKDASGRPVFIDVKASRIVARLRPVSGGGATGVRNKSMTGTASVNKSETPNARNAFTSLAVTLFSDPSLYPSLLVRHKITIATEVLYTRYEWSGDREMKLLDVARHFAACGINEETGKEMGGWAREYAAMGGPSV